MRTFFAYNVPAVNIGAGKVTSTLSFILDPEASVLVSKPDRQRESGRSPQRKFVPGEGMKAEVCRARKKEVGSP